MPPHIALAITLAFMALLLWRESRQQKDLSNAIWIPCIWLMILGSRSVTEWLHLGSAVESSTDLIEGSPTDRMVYLILIVVSVLILRSRRVSISKLCRNNVSLTVYFAYCAISVFWSDFPLVATKRWIKALGDPLMALLLLTDRDPVRAIETVFRRCAIVLLPLSVLFIKYYPRLGRGYSEWTGAAYYTGVTTNKNLLGYLLLVFGLFLICSLLGRKMWIRRPGRIGDILTALILLSMIGWLFKMADSMTPLVGLICGTLVVASLGVNFVKRNFGAVLTMVLVVFTVLQFSFGITETLISSTGRDSTLTGRTDLWASVLSIDVNPLIGVGFETFWLGDRLKSLWAAYYFKPTQAHNGYLEVYLNLGWIGVLILTGVLLVSFGTLKQRLALVVDSKTATLSEMAVAKFGVAFFTVYILYNITEATFKSLNFLFIIFLLVTLRYPLHQPEAVEARTPEPVRWRRASLPAQHAARTSSSRADKRPLTRLTARRPVMTGQPRRAKSSDLPRSAVQQLLDREAASGAETRQSDACVANGLRPQVTENKK